jgi:hypothetical protein
VSGFHAAGHEKLFDTLLVPPSGHVQEEDEEPPTDCAYATDENGRVVQEWNYLSNFFKRYNKVRRGG